jgi:protocatechuate 3,4-dioxygenase beta subunit
MKYTTAILLALVPAIAYAAPETPKDKYICNCHITPGVASLKVPKEKTVVVHKQHTAHHKISSNPAQPAIIKTEAKKEPAPEPQVESRPSPKALRNVQLNDQYPGRDAIIPSNKLALPAGKSAYASGELVYVSGRVLDENCVPVSDAIVDIWQLDPTGHYVTSTLGDRISPDPHFTGSGRAITNNLGQFNFVTLFPGTRDGDAPHINVHVIHQNLGTLDTEMYFEGEKHNASAARLSSMPADQQKLLMAKVWQRDPNHPDKGLSAQWDISLRGKNPWRHF